VWLNGINLVDGLRSSVLACITFSCANWSIRTHVHTAFAAGNSFSPLLGIQKKCKWNTSISATRLCLVGATLRMIERVLDGFTISHYFKLWFCAYARGDTRSGVPPEAGMAARQIL
jgi:hypothetical protein